MDDNQQKQKIARTVDAINFIVTRSTQAMIDAVVAEFGRTVPQMVKQFYDSGFKDGVESLGKKDNEQSQSSS